MTLDTVFWAESVTNHVYKTDPKHELALERRQAILQATTAFVSILICGVTFIGIQHTLNHRGAPIVVKLIQLDQPTTVVIPSLQEQLSTSTPVELPSQVNITGQDQSSSSVRSLPSEVNRALTPIKKVQATSEPKLPQKITSLSTDKKNDEKVVAQEKNESPRDQETEAPKQIDIAPAAKVGIQHINSRSIDLVNGRRINIGEKLPNGELLMSIDSTTGRIETDRRVIMVTQ